MNGRRSKALAFAGGDQGSGLAIASAGWYILSQVNS